MGNEQTNIFELIYPKYKITKPIRLIEMHIKQLKQ